VALVRVVASLDDLAYLLEKCGRLLGLLAGIANILGAP